MLAVEPTLQGCNDGGRCSAKVAIGPGSWELVVVVCGFFVVVIARTHGADDVFWSACCRNLLAKYLVVGLVEVYGMKSEIVAFPDSWEGTGLLSAASSFPLQVVFSFLKLVSAVPSSFSDFLLVHPSLLRSGTWPDLVVLLALLAGWPSSSFGYLGLASTWHCFVVIFGARLRLPFWNSERRVSLERAALKLAV